MGSTSDDNGDPSGRSASTQAEGPVPTYEVVDDLPPAPALPGDVIVARDLDRLIDIAAADLVMHAENCVRTFGDFHLALSGGSQTEPLCRRLMYDPNYRRLPWRRTHLWIVDERCVPFDDPASHYRVIDETIVDHADIPREQVHPIFAESETPDVDYEAQMRESLAWREKGHDRLDFVLLGMGDDGGTASLFPHEDALHEKRRLMRVTAHPESASDRRVTMTLPMINAARFIAVMVVGATKADAVRRVATGRDTPQELPIKGVSPLSGELKWYLDAAACTG